MKKILLAVFLASVAVANDSIVMLPPADVSCTTGGVRLIVANPLRKYLLIVNKGANQVNVAPDAAPTSTLGIPIPSNLNYEQNVSAGTNSWYCKSQSGTNTVTVMEGY